MYFDNLTNLRIENMFWYKDRLRLTVAAGCGVGGGDCNRLVLPLARLKLIQPILTNNHQ